MVRSLITAPWMCIGAGPDVSFDVVIVELPATSLRFAEQIALAAWVLSFLRGRPLGIKYSRPMIQLPCIYKHNRIVSSAHQRTDPNNSTCPELVGMSVAAQYIHTSGTVVAFQNATTKLTFKGAWFKTGRIGRTGHAHVHRRSVAHLRARPLPGRIAHLLSLICPY